MTGATQRIFREAAIDRLSSPDQLDQLVGVTRPLDWLAAAAAMRLPSRAPIVARTAEASPAVMDRAVADRDESAVVLVVLDGVRWQDVFQGVDLALAQRHGFEPHAWRTPGDLMPNLHRLIERDGVAVGAPGRGAAMTATGPQFISLPGYLEIFAGKPDPTCDRNDCPAIPIRTVLDDVAAASGTDDVAVVASWLAIAAYGASPIFLYVGVVLALLSPIAVGYTFYRELRD